MTVVLNVVALFERPAGRPSKFSHHREDASSPEGFTECISPSASGVFIARSTCHRPYRLSSITSVTYGLFFLFKVEFSCPIRSPVVKLSGPQCFKNIFNLIWALPSQNVISTSTKQEK
ncbi:hypothetical protein NPIL_6711 [Nephila pilipes]|uniref:Uncharacterized protein n=1 Tax=Nephila pilipes TaxID=299642 RepID=A0A8X6Q8C8_NEPPI|nr:hypothetical protein NPIL_6711 [Nephila pilipes]